MNNFYTRIAESAARSPDLALDRKARSDSPLRQLPEARQQEIIERLKTASLVEVSRELTIAGFPVSPRVLCSFRNWYFGRLQRRVSQICQVLGELEALRQHVQGGHMSPLSGEQVSNIAHQAFAARLILHGDSTGWARAQRMYLQGKELKIKERALAIKDRRNDLIERMQAQLATISDNENKTVAPGRQPAQEHPTNSSAAVRYEPQPAQPPPSEPQPGEADRNDKER
jgi:hypothetical protein